MDHNMSLEEFEKIINTYILPFLSIDRSEYENIRASVCDKDVKVKSLIEVKDGMLSCYSNVGYAKYKMSIPTSVKDLRTDVVKEVLNTILNFRKYCHIDRDDKEGTDVAKALLDLAFEKGLCRWLSGRKPYQRTIFAIIQHLNDWSLKTYEGDSVAFSFGIKEGFADEPFNYIDFLKSNYSATLTDDATSGIMVSHEGRFIKYLSCFNDTVANPDSTVSPVRFMRLVEKFHQEGCMIVIILTKEGDILIFKNQELVLIKRASKWNIINFCVFRSSLYNNEEGTKTETDNKLKLFNTLLDVSFSHKGCCLGIVDTGKIHQIRKIIYPIDRFDIEGKTLPDDLPEKMLKREAIIHLLKSCKTDNFFDLDYSLREELLGLDGATIIDTDGKIIAIGAILTRISHDDAGGGRSAAAKTLSHYGIGIKVSTDGGITVIKSNQKIYSAG
jgi:hypothetical protein